MSTVRQHRVRAFNMTESELELLLDKASLAGWNLVEIIWAPPNLLVVWDKAT